MVISAQTIILWVNSTCLSVFGFVHIKTIGSTTVTVLYTIVIFVVSDLSRYWLHRAMHAIPFLWAFHKVHHSAEVLNPVTFYRIHPVENFLFGLRYALVIGGVTGIFIYLFGAKVQLVDILGANALLFVFNFIGGNLRHSHIELSYPSVLEKIFISPRQHQLHHTYHFTRYNYGGYLAIWDTIFKTVKLTDDALASPYGLGDKENARFQHLLDLFLSPFYEVITKWHRKYFKRL
ncbi:MAG: sterol desaturase [Deltaproteobacteria bacterium]|nr:MAG: sterol desaturase [Deltaproteobacteria bacterium]